MRGAILVTFFNVLFFNCLLFGAEPKLFDLDGREAVVRVYSQKNMGGSPKTLRATVHGRTIKLDVSDPNEFTSFSMGAVDQTDPVMREFLRVRARRWAYTRLGLEYFIYYSPIEFEGRKMVVRIYQDGSDVSDYSVETLVISDRKVKCDFGEPDYPAFIVIFGEDQEDPLLKEILGNSIHGRAYKKGMEIRPPSRPIETQSHYVWEFYDALGNALTGAEVEVIFYSRDRNLKLGTFKVDSNGQVVFGFCVGGNRCRSLSGFSPNSYCKFRFMVSPSKGNKCLIEPGSCMKSGEVYLASVPIGSEADGRSAHGLVVDSNGIGVEGALIRGMGLKPVGGKWVGDIDSQRHGVFTDKLGRFRIYLPPSEEAIQIGTLIPLKTNYHVNIEPPEDSGLSKYKGDIMNGRSRTITLEPFNEYFRRFSFEGKDGPITDPLKLKDIDLKIERKNQPGIYLHYDDFKEGGMYPLGKYEATYDHPMDSYEFKSIEVTADSPEELVFKIPSGRSYCGRIVSGITGMPIRGVFVMASGGFRDSNSLSNLSSKQWQDLRQLQGAITVEDGKYPDALKPLMYGYRVRSLVQTDGDGRFHIDVPIVSAVKNLFVFNEDYMTFRVLKSIAKENRRGVHEFPDIKMFPSATVKVHPVLKVKTEHDKLKFRPQCYVYSKGSPAWAESYAASCGVHPEEGVFRDIELVSGKDNSFAVPAGLNLRMQLRVLWDIEWAPVTIADAITLRQGEVLDLGQVEIGPLFNVFVDVRNSSGKPIEGVPVIACGDWDPAISSSDENGIAMFDFVGRSKGDFIVEYRPEGRKGSVEMRESIPYNISGPKDANSVFTITVSDAMLDRLFE